MHVVIEEQFLLMQWLPNALAGKVYR